jgi:hypothetical protein
VKFVVDITGVFGIIPMDGAMGRGRFWLTTLMIDNKIGKEGTQYAQ